MTLIKSSQNVLISAQNVKVNEVQTMRVNGFRSHDPLKVASSGCQSDGNSNKRRPSRLVAQSAAALLSTGTRPELRDHGGGACVGPGRERSASVLLVVQDMRRAKQDHV